MSGLVTIELARSVERARSYYDESECSYRTVLQRVSAMLNPWSARNDCI